MSGRARIVAIAPGLSARLRDELGELFDLDVVAHPDAATAPALVILTDVALARRFHDVPVIVISDAPEEPSVVEALVHLEQTYPVQTNWRPGELASTVSRALATADSLQRRLDAVTILHDVATATTDVSSYGEILEVISRALYRIVHYDVGAAVLNPADGAGATLHLHCHTACAEALLEHTRDRCLEVMRALTGKPIDERELQVNLSGDTFGPNLISDRMESSVHIPLLLEGQPLGAIYLCARSRDAFSLEDERLLHSLAERTAEAVRRLSDRLHDERRKLSFMVESMADGLIMTDPSNEVVLCNPAARRLLGIDDDGEPVTRHYLQDVLGFYPFDLVAARSVASGADERGLVREELKIGDKVLHSIVSPVRDGAGKLVGVVVVLRDITETKELDKRKDEFVSMVSHELRTPLTSVTGALDIVLKEYVGSVTAKQRRYLQMARDSSARLNIIVDDLLDVARSERGHMPMRFRPLALDELSAEIVERYRGAAEAKHIALTLAVEAEDIRIVGDPDRLTQVLNNLLSNAIKFTPEGGRIDCEVFGPSVAASHVGVSVYNNGLPIPAASRERVFDKFEQIQESNTRRVGGTGLGLAISRAIVEAHGGRIWVDPRDDGTKFVFTLPAAPDGEEADDTAAPEASEDALTQQGSTILLVSTDANTTYILKGLLMERSHDVHEAHETSQALTLAREHRPSLIAVDAVSLGAEAGPLVEIIKHDPETKKAAILVVDLPEHRDRALAAGADEALAKPVDAASFRTTCDRLIAEAGGKRAARILVVDDEASIRMICREVLEAAGYVVREAEDGNKALVEAKRFRPDLMLLDVMMPDLDGFQTAQRFRADNATSLTPVIFLSARGETHDKVRAFRLGAEDYVVKPFDAAELVARVSKALERRERELSASPTTQLPGAGAIETEIERRLSDGDQYAFCYLDLDNLKAFNDYYGYAKADGVIRQTGDLIREVVSREGSGNDFIGHIAGDDFVFITTADAVDRVCTSICDTFDRLVPLYYNKVDRERGYIEAKDRYGVERKFPIMGVSIAAVTTESGPLDSFSELASRAALGKKLAKEAATGSSYVRDDKVVLGIPRPTSEAAG